jgi:hypothetical protein
LTEQGAGAVAEAPQKDPAGQTTGALSLPLHEEPTTHATPTLVELPAGQYFPGATVHFRGVGAPPGQ